jgi:hypothetical protein
MVAWCGQRCDGGLASLAWRAALVVARDVVRDVQGNRGWGRRWATREAAHGGGTVGHRDGCEMMSPRAEDADAGARGVRRGLVSAKRNGKAKRKEGKERIGTLSGRSAMKTLDRRGAAALPLQ